MRCFLLFSFLFLTASLPAQTYLGKPKHIQQILTNIQQFSKDFVAGDAEKVAAAYTEDGKIFPSNRPILEGTAELVNYWTPGGSSRVIYHKVTPVELTVVKDTAYDYGYYEGKSQSTDGEISAWKGKYVIVWKRVGKEWKIYLDCWNAIK